MAIVLRVLRFVVIAAILCFVTGFAVFAERTTRSAPSDPPPSADGVVALTGGGGARISTAMQLLDAGAARRLLITGVNPATTDEDVRRLAGGSDQTFACCVDLDRVARTTEGNAAEAAAWAQRNGYGSLILVTSDFHMPRALIELRRALGEATVYPYPVHGALLSGRPWWTNAPDTRRLLVEYVKYLFIRSRETLGVRAGSTPVSDVPGDVSDLSGTDGG